MSTDQSPTTKALSYIIVFALIMFGIYKCNACLDESAKESASHPKTRAEKVQALFSGWDGSCKPVVEVVKAAMNDPDSFEHVKTLYKDDGSVIQVYMTYRGKNAFGGVVTNSVSAKVDADGKIISIDTD